MGDVINLASELVAHLLRLAVNGRNGIQYIRPLNYYSALLAKIRRLNAQADAAIGRVVLVGNLGGGGNSRKADYSHSKSAEYLGHIKLFIALNGMDVTTRVTQEVTGTAIDASIADHDFAFMTSAAYLVPRGDGFPE
jgi:hypothetical protein